MGGRLPPFRPQGHPGRSWHRRLVLHPALSALYGGPALGRAQGKAAILATVEPFVAALIGIFAFHEAVTPYKLLGMAAIFGAILILNRRP